ncbi:MAG: hypothetical protein EPO21_02060 [Chloroflexota bacterium]|nr:MAG: hypothetical protein EPO21_02060 [Chloroflexota bacterium]
MATKKQTEAAKRNIKKAQETWQSMSPPARARAQPEGAQREEPGAGGGEYYRVQVRDEDEFVTFRTHDVGTKGHIQRLAGKRSSGSWDTQAWLIPKTDAHVEHGKLIADSEEVREVLENLGSEPVYLEADRFEAKPRPDVPEKAKPTSAQQRARLENIKKAQQARRRRAA